MAEEKLTNEEIMSEEELDEVAGGADWEIRKQNACTRTPLRN